MVCKNHPGNKWQIHNSKFLLILASLKSYMILYELRGMPAESELGMSSHQAFIAREGQHVSRLSPRSFPGTFYLFISPVIGQCGQGSGFCYCIEVQLPFH